CGQGRAAHREPGADGGRSGLPLWRRCPPPGGDDQGHGHHRQADDACDVVGERPVRSHRGGEFRLPAVPVALVARWLHLASSVLLVGGAAMLLLAGPSERPTARSWETRIVRDARWLILIALLPAVLAVAGQTAVLEGRAGAALDGSAIVRMLLQTQGGAVWLVRGGLLLLLGAFLSVRMNLSDRGDWRGGGGGGGGAGRGGGGGRRG